MTSVPAPDCLRHRRVLISDALRRCSSLSDAEDVVQDVFARLLRTGRWQQIGSLSDEEQLRTLRLYLKSMLSRQWRFRHQQRRDCSRTVALPDVEAAALAVSDADTPATLMDRQWAVQVIESALQTLRHEMAPSQWPHVEAWLGHYDASRTGDKVRQTPLSGRDRVALCRARKRLKELLGIGEVRSALLRAA